MLQGVVKPAYGILRDFLLIIDAISRFFRIGVDEYQIDIGTVIQFFRPQFAQGKDTEFMFDKIPVLCVDAGPENPVNRVIGQAAQQSQDLSVITIGYVHPGNLEQLPVLEQPQCFYITSLLAYFIQSGFLAEQGQCLGVTADEMVQEAGKADQVNQVSQGIVREAVYNPA